MMAQAPETDRDQDVFDSHLVRMLTPAGAVRSALNIAPRFGLGYYLAMSIDEIESAVLKLAAANRLRLAEKLLESLEELSDQENAKLWAEEAIRRDKEWDADPSVGRPARDVMRDAFAKLK
jgi:hypothetical protein